jgi:2-keto-4-pentenoate hydratase
MLTMSDSLFDPAPAARRLAPLWRNRQQIKDLPPAERPRDVRDAYALQCRLADELAEPISGYKLGLSSPAAMERSGLGDPVVGFVLTSRVHRSGAKVAMPAGGAFLIEVEVVLVLDESGDAVASAHLGFEIIRSRFTDRVAVGLPSFIGDAAAFYGVVLGDELPLAELPSLLQTGATLRQDGAVVANAALGRECPDPFDGLRRLRALAAEHAMPIGGGMIVATGNRILPFETDRPGLFEATFGPATVRFTA